MSLIRSFLSHTRENTRSENFLEIFEQFDENCVGVGLGEETFLCAFSISLEKKNNNL